MFFRNGNERCVWSRAGVSQGGSLGNPLDLTDDGPTVTLGKSMENPLDLTDDLPTVSQGESMENPLDLTDDLPTIDHAIDTGLAALGLPNIGGRDDQSSLSAPV